MTEKILKTNFEAASRVGQLWEDLQNFYAARGKSLEELHKEVDQGFLADPLGLREFRNITGTVERPEVLQFCYAQEDCHPLLIQYGYPIFFGMNDWNTEQWIDDQKRYEIQTKLDTLLQQQNGTSTKVLAEKIFDWSLKEMRFNGDCPVEKNDWDALAEQCGACTESTSALHFPYSHANLNPVFYFESDWEPSMRWQDRFENGVSSPQNRNEDHVLLGIPGEKGSVFFADRIQEEFDGSHPHALSLSSMNYSGLVLMNLIPSALVAGDVKRAIPWLEAETELIPGDPFIYLYSLEFLGQLDGLDESQEIRKLKAVQKLKEELDNLNHPAKEVLLALSHLLKGKDILNTISNGRHPLRLGLAELEKTNPRIASKVYLVLANAFAQAAAKNKKALVQALQDSQESPSKKIFLEEHKKQLLQTSLLYLKSLQTNPNAVKSYLGLSALLAEYYPLIPNLSSGVAGQIGQLLAQNPDHGPLHYLKGQAMGFASLNLTGSPEETKKLLEGALAHFSFIAEKEPRHPLPPILAAHMNILLDRNALAWPLLEKAKQTAGHPLPGQYYITLLWYAFRNGDEIKFKEAITELLEDRKHDGLEIAIAVIHNLSDAAFHYLGKKTTLSELQKEEPIENVAKIMEAVEEVLEKFPRAQLALEQIRAKNAIAIGLAKGERAWRKSLLEIHDINSPEAIQGFKKGLNVIGLWLTQQYQAEEVVEWIAGIFETMAPDLPQKFQEEWVRIHMELANNYIYWGRADKAARLLDKMMENDTTQSITKFVQRVVNLPYDSVEKPLAAYDILYDRREKIAPALRQAIAKGYENFLPQIADAEKEKEIRRKITELM